MKSLYCILDKVAEDISTVFIFPGHAAAVRFFGDAARDPQSMIHRHVSDFDLIHLGDITVEYGVPAFTPADNNHDHWGDGKGHGKIILTGNAWRASQEQSNEEAKP